MRIERVEYRLRIATGTTGKQLREALRRLPDDAVCCDIDFDEDQDIYIFKTERAGGDTNG